MDQLNIITKRHGEAVIDGKDYSVGFGLDGSVCTIHRHIKAPDEKWTSIPKSRPRFALIAKKIKTLFDSSGSVAQKG